MREKIAADNEKSMKFKQGKIMAHKERMDLTKKMQIQKKEVMDNF